MRDGGKGREGAGPGRTTKPHRPEKPDGIDSSTSRHPIGNSTIPIRKAYGHVERESLAILTQSARRPQHWRVVGRQIKEPGGAEQPDQRQPGGAGSGQREAQQSGGACHTRPQRVSVLARADLLPSVKKEGWFRSERLLAAASLRHLLSSRFRRVAADH